MNTRPWVYVLQHIDIETPGTIELALQVHGLDTRVIHSSAGEAVPVEMGDAAGLVVMGGPMGVYEQEQYPFLRAELRLIENAISAQKPVLGVCLGSQLVATALGSTVTKGVRKEIGWHPVTLTEEAHTDTLWHAAPSSFVGFHWHGDVFDLPRQAVPLASSELTPCQAFRYGTSVYGLLFHLEVTTLIIQNMVATFTQEQQEEGIDGTEILRKVEEYLPPLQMIGSSVFLAWSSQASSLQS